MLTITGSSSPQFCNGRSRRNSLRIGALGGTSQLDTYDLKPNAPREIRGLYNPIQNNLPGIDVCEWLPETSRVMDRIVLLRTVVPAIDEHTDSSVMTGYSKVVNNVDLPLTTELQGSRGRPFPLCTGTPIALLL